MKIAIITDQHFGIKNDAQYMLEYQKKFYKEYFFPILIKEGIKHVINGGDLCDRRKYINFLTLYKMKEMFLNPMRDLGITMDIIPGNHDVYAKNTNEVNCLTETLGEYTNINQIHEPTKKKIGSKEFIFLPWINNENYSDTMQFVDKNTADVLVGHLELAGFEMYAGQENEHGMDSKLFSKFENVWSGHFHHKSKKGNIHYLGAPMEFNFLDSDDPRGFHIYDTETGDLTFYENPHKLHVKYYYDDSSLDKQNAIRKVDPAQFTGKLVKIYVSKKTNPVLFEMFIDSLYTQDMVDMTIVQEMSEFVSSDDDIEKIKDKSTKDLMVDYVDNIETDMDKTRLKTILNNIYIEALNNIHTNA